MSQSAIFKLIEQPKSIMIPNYESIQDVQSSLNDSFDEKRFAEQWQKRLDDTNFGCARRKTEEDSDFSDQIDE